MNEYFESIQTGQVTNLIDGFESVRAKLIEKIGEFEIYKEMRENSGYLLMECAFFGGDEFGSILLRNATIEDCKKEIIDSPNKCFEDVFDYELACGFELNFSSEKEQVIETVNNYIDEFEFMLEENLNEEFVDYSVTPEQAKKMFQELEELKASFKEEEGVLNQIDKMPLRKIVEIDIFDFFEEQGFEEESYEPDTTFVYGTPKCDFYTINEVGEKTQQFFSPTTPAYNWQKRHGSIKQRRKWDHFCKNCEGWRREYEEAPTTETKELQYKLNFLWKLWWEAGFNENGSINLEHEEYCDKLMEKMNVLDKKIKLSKKYKLKKKRKLPKKEKKRFPRDYQRNLIINLNFSQEN